MNILFSKYNEQSYTASFSYIAINKSLKNCPLSQSISIQSFCPACDKIKPETLYRLVKIMDLFNHSIYKW